MEMADRAYERACERQADIRRPKAARSRRCCSAKAVMEAASRTPAATSHGRLVPWRTAQVCAGAGSLSRTVTTASTTRMARRASRQDRKNPVDHRRPAGGAAAARLTASGRYGRTCGGRTVRWNRAAVRKELAGVVEEDHPVAEHAPALIRMTGYRPCAGPVGAIHRRTWRLVATHDTHLALVCRARLVIPPALLRRHAVSVDRSRAGVDAASGTLGAGAAATVGYRLAALEPSSDVGWGRGLQPWRAVSRRAAFYTAALR